MVVQLAVSSQEEHGSQTQRSKADWQTGQQTRPYQRLLYLREHPSQKHRLRHATRRYVSSTHSLKFSADKKTRQPTSTMRELRIMLLYILSPCINKRWRCTQEGTSCGNLRILLGSSQDLKHAYTPAHILLAVPLKYYLSHPLRPLRLIPLSLRRHSALHRMRLPHGKRRHGAPGSVPKSLPNSATASLARHASSGPEILATSPRGTRGWRRHRRLGAGFVWMHSHGGREGGARHRRREATLNVALTRCINAFQSTNDKRKVCLRESLLEKQRSRPKSDYRRHTKCVASVGLLQSHAALITINPCISWHRHHTQFLRLFRAAKVSDCNSTLHNALSS